MFVWAFDMTGKKVLCVQVRAGTFPTHPPLYARVWARASLFRPSMRIYLCASRCILLKCIGVQGWVPVRGRGSLLCKSV